MGYMELAGEHASLRRLAYAYSVSQSRNAQLGFLALIELRLAVSGLDSGRV